METVAEFLSGLPALSTLDASHLAVVATCSREETLAAGDVVLRQGTRNHSLYFVRSGRLTIQIRQADSYQTVASLYRGAPFGELSLITGRPCSADVIAASEASVIVIAMEAMNDYPEVRGRILNGLVTILGERLHTTIMERHHPARPPVVLLHSYPHWPAPTAVAAQLAQSLNRQAGWPVVIVDIARRPAKALQSDAAGSRLGSGRVALDARSEADTLVKQFLTLAEECRSRSACVLVNPAPECAWVVPALRPHCDWHGHLLGPSDTPPAEIASGEFALQDQSAATLDCLSGREQLVPGAREAEEALAAGRRPEARFDRKVDSIARYIAGLQIGLALGGGGAWGFAHIGVLRAFKRAGLPVDVLAGCSMGSYIGALAAAGHDPDTIEDLARQWGQRFHRLIEYRFWRMQLGNERAVRRFLREQLGDGLVNQTEVPFWANALDIETGEEVTLRNGSLVDAVRASSALAGWTPPVRIGSRLLIDAALIDPVPAGLIRRMGCQFVIAVNAIGPLKASSFQPSPFRAHDYVLRCLRIAGHEIGRVRAEISADAVLVPELGDTNMLSLNQIAEIVPAGEREAERRLPAILASYERLRPAAAS